jgi:hypothetical protein
MESVLVLAGLALVCYIVCQFFKSTHVVNDYEFTQAGVTVKFNERIVNIGGKEYPLDAIRSYRWESGIGKHENVSRAIIELKDINNPIFKTEFITPGAAEEFLSRFELALNRAKETSYS